jgi:hypothetical protein
LIRLTSANSPNDDPVFVKEDTIEFMAVVSTAPATFTQIGFGSGNTINVKQSPQEILDAIVNAASQPRS